MRRESTARFMNQKHLLMALHLNIQVQVSESKNYNFRLDFFLDKKSQNHRQIICRDELRVNYICILL